MTEQTVQKASPHKAAIRVLYGDTDAGGVVYYGNYLRYFEFGRTELMRDLVVPYSELHDAGLILPVVECHCRYKASARYDDLIIVETILSKIKPISCRFDYRLLQSDSGRLLVHGYTVHVVVDGNSKLQRIPKDLLAKLSALCRQQATAE